jgi:hypothetical protein
MMHVSSCLLLPQNVQKDNSEVAPSVEPKRTVLPNIPMDFLVKAPDLQFMDCLGRELELLKLPSSHPQLRLQHPLLFTDTKGRSNPGYVIRGAFVSHCSALPKV